ncbi:MAG: S24/S26 family peptidase [Bdellovibrionales bacterium]|nr:S24/S26 family peptidase [Bdellovibrionales bacterium]
MIVNYSDFKLYKEIVNHKGHLDIKIVSDSMLPLIQVNEKLRITNLAKEPKRFEILVYWSVTEEKLICHFLWQTHEDGDHYFFKSLKNPKETDAPVESQYILGVLSSRKISFFCKLKIYLINLFS